MNRNRLILCFCLMSLLGLSSYANAQDMPAAVRPIQVQIGGGFSFAKPDYGYPYIKGFTVYGDAAYRHLFGVEADVHYNSILTPTDIGENTYMIGPRVSLIHEDRMNFYAKALGGVADFEYQKGTYPNPHTDTYGAFAVGGGIEFRASRHIVVRAIDIEGQWWPGFEPHGLTPFVTTFGVAYGD